ncbi:unnamed protein product [Lota lota]
MWTPRCSEAAHPLYRGPINPQGSIVPLLPPQGHFRLLCLAGVQEEVVILTPADQNKSGRCQHGPISLEFKGLPAQKHLQSSSYGFVNWQPHNLAEGEPVHSLEDKRPMLVTLYMKEGPRAEVVNLVHISYLKQCQLIYCDLLAASKVKVKRGDSD